MNSKGYTMKAAKWITTYKEDNAKFRNKNGSLSPYAFCCGYREVWSNDLYITLDGCFHVRGIIKGARVWETFNKVSEARNYTRNFIG